MTQRSGLLLACLCLCFSSCEEFYKDDFQSSLPPEKSINISFPGLVDFEIRQSVIPDNQNLNNKVMNAYVITNESNKPIGQLKFVINIFDSQNRYESNLQVAFLDSLKSPLNTAEKTNKQIFDQRFNGSLTEDMVEIHVLAQDITDTHQSNGRYLGEAFVYPKGQDDADKIPLIKGVIDYQGDLQLRASGNEVDEFLISGRVSNSGQFIGKAMTSTSSNALNGDLKTKTTTSVLLEGNQLNMCLVPSNASSSSLDSIRFILNRN